MSEEEKEQVREILGRKTTCPVIYESCCCAAAFPKKCDGCGVYGMYQRTNKGGQA